RPATLVRRVELLEGSSHAPSLKPRGGISPRKVPYRGDGGCDKSRSHRLHAYGADAAHSWPRAALATACSQFVRTNIKHLIANGITTSRNGISCSAGNL